ncbi:sporulation protein YtxC [Paenactinomyces guangxiensis]|uniref:Putative sporulation protein YtxC n=1 Tax=Paenactinomyces guangxiensis TaxID=1490290 RepID=A0A7W2AB58_9BACL|nr:putative sporulation protein YtxC [Paenactinomyces guangxiensis]MBA4496548.1 putative sporulation protein YtxC [Paenactinomyces guangxiensis]MBH8593673.1 putative sporulation protein YtxC [Paenactinomyces guangxiensis]
MAYLVSIFLKERAKVIQLRACLETLITQLQEKGFGCSLEERIIGDRQFFLCTSGSKNRSQERKWQKLLGQTMAEFICDCQEPEMIRHIIRSEYQVQYTKEITQIEGYARRLLESSAWEHARIVYVSRRQKLAKQISLYLKESNKMAVDGFVRFRMKTYRKALSKCVKEALDEYLLDKEYKEFIQLLRYFVSVQIPKMDVVHVIHQGRRRLHMLKADGTPLKFKEMDGAAHEVMEPTFSHEDFIVSTLLNIAPEKVILHTRDPEENIVRTLIQIFEDRILVCNSCSKCGIPLNFHGDA